MQTYSNSWGLFLKKKKRKKKKKTATHQLVYCTHTNKNTDKVHKKVYRSYTTNFSLYSKLLV